MKTEGPLRQRDIEEILGEIRAGQEDGATLKVRFGNLPTEFVYSGYVSQDEQHKRTLRGLVFQVLGSHGDPDGPLTVELNLDKVQDIMIESNAVMDILKWGGDIVSMELLLDYNYE